MPCLKREFFKESPWQALISGVVLVFLVIGIVDAVFTLSLLHHANVRLADNQALIQKVHQDVDTSEHAMDQASQHFKNAVSDALKEGQRIAHDAETDPTLPTLNDFTPEFARTQAKPETPTSGAKDVIQGASS